MVRDAGIVEEDDLAPLRQAGRHDGTAMVQRAREMLVEDDRRAFRIAEAAVRETDAVRLAGAA